MNDAPQATRMGLARFAAGLLIGVSPIAAAAPCDAPAEAAVEKQCQRELAALQARMETLLKTYTALHPDVRALRRTMDEKAACVTAPSTPASEARAADAVATVTIDTTAPRQALQGFGATHALSVLQSDRMTDDQWRRVITSLVSDIGALTGEGPPAVEATRPDAPGTGTGFSRALDFGGNAKLFRMFDRFSPASVGDIYPFASINVRWSHPWLKEVRTTNYPRYLDEVAGKALATVADWKARSGREPEFLQLWNEPLAGNGELGGSAQELIDTIRHVGRRLREAGYARVRFVVPNEETVRGTLEVMRAIAADAQALAYVGAIGYHAYPYGSEYAYVPRLLATRAQGREFEGALRDRVELRNLSFRLGLPVWMTEVSHGYERGGAGGEREAQAADSIDWILGRAIHIHDEFRYAGASAYFGMMAIWTDAVERDHSAGAAVQNLRSEGDSLVLVDTTTNEVMVSAIGHAMGHYGRWLRRGARYLDGDSSNPFVLVSAFIDRGRLVAVLVNTARSAVHTTMRLRDAVFSGGLAGDQTRTGVCREPIKSFDADGPSLDLDLPAWSVTTIAVPLRQITPP